MWNNSSISAAQRLVLFSLWKAFRLIPTWCRRDSVLKLRVEKHRVKGGTMYFKIAVNQVICTFSCLYLQFILQVFVCTFSFYVCLWSYLFATSQLSMKSVKVFNVYLSVSAQSTSCAGSFGLIITLHFAVAKWI